MKVVMVLCACILAVQANPQFRALRARASGLGGSQQSAVASSSPVASAGIYSALSAAAGGTSPIFVSNSGAVVGQSPGGNQGYNSYYPSG